VNKYPLGLSDPVL